MKTSNYLIALAALTSFTFVSCSDNDFLGDGPGPNVAQQGNGEITFTSSSKKLTRAGEASGKEAATKLNNIFVVWGEKNESQDAGSVMVNGAATSVAEAGTGAKAADQDRTFMNYLVKYTDGSAGNTESNSRGWEYVGNTPYTNVTPKANEQTIKYWDWAASAYTFYGFSAKPEDLASGNVVAEKTVEALTGNLNFDKGYTVTLNGLASLDDLYFTKRLVIKNKLSGLTDGQPSYASADDNKVGGVVNLTFQAAAAKIRFGIYETIPGYSVNIDKVYYGKTALIDNPNVTTGGSSVNFGVNGDFVVPGDGTQLIVTYSPDDAVKIGTTTIPKNTPIVNIKNAAKSGYFETDDPASPWMTDAALGITSNAASFNLPERAYKAILPNTTNTKDIVLTLDYTLTSTDGSGEKIKVYGASAHVPASFSQWQSNFAYTYLFKITDNTNGHTGTPGSTDPKGLYPITFDAVVLNSELGDQETITTIANPSITTYQNGSKVVDNDEYLAATGNIYVTVTGAGNTLEDLTGKYSLYTAVDLGKDKETITEAALANYANNDIVLTDVTSAISVADATAVPMSGVVNDPAVAAGKVVMFTPTAGNTYVFKYEVSSGLYAYKVIKVEGATASHTYAIAGGATIEEGSTATITIKETVGTTDCAVTGAQKYITTGSANMTAAEESTPGTYTLTAHEGLEGAVYGVSLASQDGTTATSNTHNVTATSYAFAAGVVIPEDVATADNKTVTIQSKAGSAAYAALTTATAGDFQFVKASDGSAYTDITVADVTAGVVKLNSTALLEDCKIQYVKGTKVLAEADITVKKYAFNASKYYVNKSTNATPVVTTASVGVTNAALTSCDGRTVASAAIGTATGSAVASGAATVTPVAKGTTTISLGSATADVEVTEFTVKFYNDFECTADGTFAADKYVRFFDNAGNPAYATLKATGCTLERISTTGAYKISSAAGTAKIEFVYNGATFKLAEK